MGELQRVSGWRPQGGARHRPPVVPASCTAASAATRTHAHARLLTVALLVDAAQPGPAQAQQHGRRGAAAPLRPADTAQVGRRGALGPSPEVILSTTRPPLPAPDRGGWGMRARRAGRTRAAAVRAVLRPRRSGCWRCAPRAQRTWPRCRPAWLTRPQTPTSSRAACRRYGVGVLHREQRVALDAECAEGWLAGAIEAHLTPFRGRGAAPGRRAVQGRPGECG
jgi:hypothetical protein